MVFDYRNLKGEIKKKYNSYMELSKACGITKSLIQEHIRKGVPFRIDQIMLIVNALGLEPTTDVISNLFYVVKS